MKNRLSEEDMETFDRYLKGRMDTNEIKAFHNNLADDPSLKESFLLYKMIVEKVKADAEVTESLKRRLYNVSKKSKRNIWFKWLSGMAAILIISFFALRVIPQKQTDYGKYMFEEPGLTIQMTINTENKWGAFNNSFANKEYETCLKLLEKSGQSDTATYYSGICNEFLKHTHNALKLYQTLYNSKCVLIRDKAMYRSSILLLNDDKLLEATTLLRLIVADQNNPYKIDANKLLNDINGKK